MLITAIAAFVGWRDKQPRRYWACVAFGGAVHVVGYALLPAPMLLGRVYMLAVGPALLIRVAPLAFAYTKR